MNDYNTWQNDNDKSTSSRWRTLQDRNFQTSLEAKIRSNEVRNSAGVVLNVL